MGRVKETLKNGQRISRLVLSVFVVFCLILGVLCFQYYHRLQDTVKAEAGNYLQEIAKQVCANTNKTMKDNFSVLRTVESVLRTDGVSTYPKFQAIVAELQHEWNFENIMMIDEKGTAYDAKGRIVTLKSAEYLREAVIERKASMSVSQIVGDREFVVFAIPVENLSVDGIRVHALASSYDVNTFEKVLAASTFDGKGYAQILRQDGAVAIRSSSEKASWIGYNLLHSLADAKTEDGRKIDDVKADFAKVKSGKIEFKLNEMHNYMVYTPIDTGEWVFVGIIPVKVANAHSVLFMKITLIMCSGITIIFSVLVAVLALSFYRHKRKLEEIAYIDPITGGHTIQRFYELTQTVLKAQDERQYALVYTNIEKFKVLNEQFGRPVCDDILRSVQEGISGMLTDKEWIGRLSADNFCIFAEYQEDAAFTARLGKWHDAIVKEIGRHGFFRSVALEAGIYVIENKEMFLPQMIDRAKLALREPSHKFCGKLRYAFFDEVVRRKLFREKQLEDRMEEALENREFQIYLQPKYSARDERIIGAEALVRWVKHSEGMVYPDEFIPLFEKNGFIVHLDLWVFEEVCRTIREWIDEGREPLSVSVNCSRVHLSNRYFFDRYREIYEKYSIPANLLEIELTENVVFEDVTNLSQIIRSIKETGCACSMDDFGSGYSSLNLLKDIPVDTLKLDKVFFRDSAGDVKRAESVIGSIISMAKSLDMRTVAEGVEERFQVDMLKRLECDYIQGYYFARPMTLGEFNRLAFKEEKAGGECS